MVFSSLFNLIIFSFNNVWFLFKKQSLLLLAQLPITIYSDAIVIQTKKHRWMDKKANETE